MLRPVFDAVLMSANHPTENKTEGSKDEGAEGEKNESPSDFNLGQNKSIEGERGRCMSSADLPL